MTDFAECRDWSTFPWSNDVKMAILKPFVNHAPADGDPLVSVIIPTFNRGWTITEAIESVLIQDGTPFELIVVDDGSTDATGQILDRYGEQITVIRQQNQGVSNARNAGIRVARGGLIAFLDSDDYWLPAKMITQVEFFKTHPDAWICQTEEIWIRNGQRVNPKERHRKRSGMIFYESLALCLVSPSAVMMRRELFDVIGCFDETLPACEDYDMWLRVSSRYPVFLIDTPLIVKRGGHDDQLSRMPGLDRYRIQSLVKLLSSGRLTHDQSNATMAMLREKGRIYAHGCLKRGKTDEARYTTRLVEKYAPSGGLPEIPAS